MLTKQKRNGCACVPNPPCKYCVTTEPTLLGKIYTRMITKRGYKIVAEAIAFFMLMAVIYAWYILGAAYLDIL